MTIRLLLLLVALMALGVTTVFAAKPSGPDHNVVEWSNGFPSGPHFNLNIHGKKSEFTCPAPDPETGYGGSVFVPEYGDALIQYFQNKRSSVEELLVHDACAEVIDNLDGEPIKIQLPKGQYQVYARILGKPAKTDEPREVLFYPRLIDQCDFLAAPAEGDGDLTDCSDTDVVGLGLVTEKEAFVFDQTSQSLERIDPTGGKGKGKSKAVDISSMFQWTGYVCDADLDTNADELIDERDVPEAYDTNGTDGIQEDELLTWLNDQVVAGTCELFTDDAGLWVFDIADLVVYGWDYKNNGSKLVQIRLYPIENFKLSPDVVTEIHDEDHSLVPIVDGIPTAPLGTAVHDKVAVTGPTSGTVSFVWYENGDCSGTWADSTGPLSLGGDGTVDATSFAQTPLVAGLYAFRLRYIGNSDYDAKWSLCEPLRVLDPA